MTRSVALLLLLSFFTPATGAGGAEYRPMVGVLHVHSTVSTGAHSLDQLLTAAEQNGIEAVLLTENLLLRFEYGLFPFRNLLRSVERGPGILDVGPERFLAEVEEAQRRHPRVILIPGAEVTPHYFWTGAPWTRDLTMHNGQKNLLILGLTRPEAYRKLPVAGSPAASSYTPRSLLLLSPFLLVGLGFWLYRSHSVSRRRWHNYTITEQKRHRVLGLLFLSLGLAGLLNTFPFRVTRYSLYRDLGIRPFQDVIDAAIRQGGVVLWSFPEARDFQTHRRGPFTVTIRTDPYPQDLTRTTAYTGFGALYEDTTVAEEPGNLWDQLLAASAAKERPPVFGVGEAGYHFEGQAGKKLINILTVFLAEERSREGILQALRAGRMYALQRTAEYGLVLDEFTVGEIGRETVAHSGEIGRVTQASRLQIRITIRSTDGKPHPVEGRLVRGGSVVHTFRGLTPLREAVTEKNLAAGTATYYRLLVRGETPHRLLSNPIFVETGRPS